MHYHDKKTTFTHPQGYSDLDGNRRNFTFVDHDRKTKISVPADSSDPKEELKKSRNVLVEKILSINAMFCPVPFAEFTIRGEQVQTIEWNETMLADEGLPFQRLQDLYTITSNRQDLYSQGLL